MVTYTKYGRTYDPPRLPKPPPRRLIEEADLCTDCDGPLTGVGRCLACEAVFAEAFGPIPLGLGP